MKKLIFFALIILTAVSSGFLLKSNKPNFLTNFIYYSPCNTPIAYSIGTIDSRFNITKEELLTDVKSAANIWNTTQNKQLFVYEPDSEFTINMVYDDRQELTSKISDLNTTLKEKQSEIDPKILDFEKRQDLLEQEVTDLNKRISYWNTQGGAPKEEYEKLVSEQKNLQIEISELNRTAKELGQSTKEYNSNAQILNNTITDYKNVLEERPEEGLYEQDGSNRKISIYIDVNEDEFLHTVAHELGHALGLEHTNDPESIMYPKTTNDLTPSSEDLFSLGEICKERLIFEVALLKLKEIGSYVTSKLGEKIN